MRDADLSESSMLSGWQDGPVKRTIVDFVKGVSTAGPAFVPEEERVAVFDNDGTLWCEKPMPIQADFLLRRLAEMAEASPELRERQPWKAAITKDYRWLGDVITKHYRGDDRDLKTMSVGLLRAYEGASIEDFEAAAEDYLTHSENPVLHRPYLACAYEPMQELLGFLRAHGFTNYIASGGGRDFMRPVTERLYGIPPERVIGSSVTLEYREDEGRVEVVHGPKLDLFDDGPAKPVRIWSRIGRRPIFAAGNSNGDIPMLRFVGNGARPALSLIVRHDDEAREFDYAEGAEKALATAAECGWTIASMKDDWKRVFAA